MLKTLKRHENSATRRKRNLPPAGGTQLNRKFSNTTFLDDFVHTAAKPNYSRRLLGAIKEVRSLAAPTSCHRRNDDRRTLAIEPQDTSSLVACEIFYLQGVVIKQLAIEVGYKIDAYQKTFRPKLSSVDRVFAGKSTMFLYRANQLADTGRVDSALDLLYDGLDKLLRSGDFQVISDLLADEQVSNLSTDVLLGILTATLPAKSRISSRRDFLCKAKNEIVRRGHYEENLLTGLD